MVNSTLLSPSCENAGPPPSGREEAGACPTWENVAVELKNPWEIDHSEILTDLKHPSDLWETKVSHAEQKRYWVEFLLTMADWRSFITFTFKKDKHPELALKDFTWWLRAMNKHAFGKNYRNFVKHSYFSYVLAIEWTSLDVVHFHALIDRPIDYAYSNRLWNAFNGFMWIDKIGNVEDTCKYIVKYAVKGNELVKLFEREQVRTPRVKPEWWIERANFCQGRA